MSEQVPLNQQQVPDGSGAMNWEQGQPQEMSVPVAQNYTKQDSQNVDSMADDDAMKDTEDKITKEKESTDLAREEVDSRSIYVGNVDYGATPLEIQQHFAPAGEVERVTILLNKFTGQPKGFAYVEFKTKESVVNAVETLDGSQFRDRELKVSGKRTNIPGLSSTSRGGRGAFRGRGRGRGFRGRGPRGFRGGRGGGPRFNPY